MYLSKSIRSVRHRRELDARFDRLTPDLAARWGSLTAPRMLAHLGDQMRLVLAKRGVEPRRYPGDRPWWRELFLYLLPWPRAKLRGPPAAFETPPARWSEDLALLRRQVDEFVALVDEPHWPKHPVFGPMSHRSWGYFCYRHFDHHLRQFGV